jgi:membrane-associated phospholipid phosphatase
MKKFISGLVTEIEIKTLLVSLLFLIALFGFGLLAHAISGGNEASFDESAFHFFAAHSNRQFINFCRIFTFFGSAYFFVPAYIILIIFLFIKRRNSDAINVLIVAITSTALMFALKQFFHRKRPSLPLVRTLTNFSFPSGHALSSFIFCSVIIYLIWKGKMTIAWKWILSVLMVLFSIAIGISRVILRYHYASDVIAGFCAGLVWVIFSLWLERKLTSRQVELKLDAAN